MQILTGIYEQVINQAIDNGLKQIDPEENLIDVSSIDGAEAQHILADYLSKVIEKGLIYIKDIHKDNSKNIQISVCNDIIAKLSELSNSEDLLEWKIGEEGNQLLSVVKKTNQRLKENRPITSLSLNLKEI